MKRKTPILLLPLLFSLVLAACGGQEAAAPDPADVTAAELARTVAESQEDLAGLPTLKGEDLTDHLSAFCGLTDWEDGAVYAAGGMDAREITVVLLSDEASAETAADTLENYRLERQGDFFGYAPEEADRLDRAVVLQRGQYAALLVCDDPEAARESFDACLAGELPPPVEEETTLPTPSEEPEATQVLAPETETPEPEPSPTPEPEPTPSEPPEETEWPILNPDLDTSDFVPFTAPNDANMEIYDTSAIRAAWETGDEDGLSDKDAAILEQCRAVLGELITEDMTDFQKELAVHDWIVEHGSYDQTVHNNPGHSGRTGYRDPYGILVGGYGNCLGYSTTFQLLMDLCDVECITVVGAAFDSMEDHAWNMVRLDGEWYCVDVTWDDPTMGNGNTNSVVRHRYFNVTSQHMRDTDHQWDYLYVPEATATQYRWDGAGALPQ
ncbi:DUF4358 domain-containing protein [Intestinimonas aquisgranensis]|nr:DUF4358 domain-containing protein [Intestinimonas aquisgranensis]